MLIPIYSLFNWSFFAFLKRNEDDLTIKWSEIIF